jgi:predicted metal-dependent enzyme (double-stranded beta helix superfamily)
VTKPTLLAELDVDQWVAGLARISATDFSQENVQHYIHQHAIVAGSLNPYTFFPPRRYTRNLIFKNEVFECLALCWDIGQSSSVHNHDNRLGWVYLSSGRLFVQNYVVEAQDPVRRTCRVIPTGSVKLHAGQAADVDREEGVHKVCNLPRFQERAISVHVYQSPMNRCQVYSLETGTYETVDLSYASEYGRPNPGMDLT